MNDQLPFAIIGSTEFVKVGGKMARARQYPWGIVQGNIEEEDFKIIFKSFFFCQIIPLIHFMKIVENDGHCDFNKLREMLIRTNMEDLRDSTHTSHYEVYRRDRLKQVLAAFSKF